MASHLLRTTFSQILRHQRPICWNIANSSTVQVSQGIVAEVSYRFNSTNPTSARTAAPISHDIQREVDHHETMAEGWWDVNGIAKALHSLNAIRVPFVRDGMIARGQVAPELIGTGNVLKDQKILEIGCGGGLMTEQLARLGGNITALDLSEVLIKVARDHLSQEADPKLCDRIEYRIESVETHVKGREDYYDAVVISEVLEHIDDKVGFLTASVQCLKPGGSIFITTLSKTISMWFWGIVVSEYLLKAIPIGTHHYGKMIKPLECQRLLDTLGCNTVLVNGCMYQIWNNTWRWTDSQNLNYALQAVKTEL